MIVTCGDIECQYYNPNGCTAPAVDHTADRFCITGRRRQAENYAGMMRTNNPNCHKDGSGKYKSNRVTLLK